ncbi:MAG: amidohydrolase family protein [Candidatus Binatia bacterium]
MFTLIDNGDLYGPEPLGQQTLLIVGEAIASIGSVSRADLQSWTNVEFVDAGECFVLPGFIDPHEHILGGSGEKGFSSQTPEISLSEIVTAGITTVVGCLGVDTTTKTLAGLLAKAKGLKEEGLNALIFSGGYNVPPTTITSSIRDDLLFIDEVIGAGEIAIADRRSTQPRTDELARLVSDAYVGGLLAGKSGVTHFHVGNGTARLQSLRELIDHFEIDPRCLYPTHITRSEELLKEAIDLTRLGSYVDIDVTDEDLPFWLRFYQCHGGDFSKLTISSDASITSPHNLYEQLKSCILDGQFTLSEVLRLATANTAEVLRLPRNGRLVEGNYADILIADKQTLELRHVFSKGRALVRDSKLSTHEHFLESSNRRINLRGQRT